MSVQDALVKDVDAPRSLVNEISGDKTPDWYNNLPKEQRQLFLTERAPMAPESTVGPITDGAWYADPGSLDTFENQYAWYDMAAKVAKHESKIARELSRGARKMSVSELESAAKTLASYASIASENAHDSKKALEQSDPAEYNKVKNRASSTVSVPKSPALFTFSFTLAVASLGMALYF